MTAPLPQRAPPPPPPPRTPLVQLSCFAYPITLGYIQETVPQHRIHKPEVISAAIKTTGVWVGCLGVSVMFYLVSWGGVWGGEGEGEHKGRLANPIGQVILRTC